MPLYDVICPACDRAWERVCRIADRDQPCEMCGGPVRRLSRLATSYQPFKPYFDISLGRQINGLSDRWTAQRQLNVQERDRMSAGDLSARKDRIEQQRREAAR